MEHMAVQRVPTYLTNIFNHTLKTKQVPDAGTKLKKGNSTFKKRETP